MSDHANVAPEPAGPASFARKVLVGLDGSPREPAVLRAAIDLARATGAMLILFRAVEPPTLPAGVVAMSGTELATFMENLARDRLLELAHQAEGLAVAVRAGVGRSWHAICEAARTEEASVIVIGSHGYHGIDRVLGTTAAKVVDHAPCSVMVVRERR